MPSYRLFETRSADAAAVASDGVAVSSTNTYRSKKMKPSAEGLLAFQLDWTGTPAGTFTLWYSNKDRPDEASDTDWVQDTTWSPTQPAGAAGKAAYTLGNLRHRWVLVKYVNASGTGTLTGRQGA